MYRFVGQKADKGKAVGGHGGQHEGANERARARQDGVRFPRLPQDAADEIAGIGDDGHARVRHDGDLFALPRSGKDLFRRLPLVEFMAGKERFFDPVGGEQFEGVAGVLAEDDVRRPEFLERAEGDILQISDGI